MDQELCSTCGKDNMLAECECPLDVDELKDLFDFDVSIKIIQIRDLQDKINSSNVFGSIEMGDVLSRIKDKIPYGQWITFIKENLGMSVRTVQNHMRIAKADIHEKYYVLGVEEIRKRLHQGNDLTRYIQ